MKNKSKKLNLRYGENPNQKAYLLNYNKKSIFDFQIGGKKISYNNIIDVDSGLKCLREFSEPTSIIIKHTNPCGVASAKTIDRAFVKVKLSLANYIVKNFFEMVVAPNFERNAIELLSTKKNLILLKIPKVKKENIDFRSTIFGKLYQTIDGTPINKNFINLVSKNKASKKSIDDLLFSLKVVKHLKSNAIVISKNKQTLGLGHGQTNRIDALKFAIKNKKSIFNTKTFVCASDGFFPFTDSIKLLYNSGCLSLAQPSGSINDRKIISFTNKNKLPLYFVKNRLFKH